MDTAERTPGAELRQQVAESFHRQHLEATGRLLASIAYDVRSAVASIVYSADFLDARGSTVQQEVLRASMRDIGEASRRLQLTVDSLLDYARLGPSISVPVSLREVLSRAQGLLRSFYRDGAHGLRVEIGPGAEWVRGNPVVIEQIFVNVLLSVAECAEAPGLVTVGSQAASLPVAQQGAGLVQVRVAGDGVALSRQFADPLLGDAVGIEPTRLLLALASAEAAATTQGGRLSLERGADDLCFVVSLPRSEGPR